MNRRLSIKAGVLALFVACSLGQTSCNKWFDVNPKTDVKADALFNTEHGYQSALAGVYVQMTDNGLYGQNLSYGFIDQMAQIYNYRPGQMSENDRAKIYNYRPGQSGGYNSSGILNDIWGKGYNIIANANNLLKWLDAKGDEVIRSQETRDMLRGEALALRAYMHFDLLRAWGPIYALDKNSRCIPYRTKVDESKQPTLPASRVIELILEDLLEARRLLAFEADRPLEKQQETRRFRLNYHAVNALLARVYCYQGDADKAIASAKEVLAKCGLSLQVSNQQDPIQYGETIFGVHKYKMEDTAARLFLADPERLDEKYYTSFETFNELFEVSGTAIEDIRAKSAAFVRFNDQEKVLSRKYTKNDQECIPLIRLPEMYYILCEMSPLDESATYLNLVRNRRGYPSSSNVRIASDADRLTQLDKEYRKEFYAEGQYFYFLKRNSFDTFINCPLGSMEAKQYVFPRPDAEIEHGWTDKTEEEGTGNNP